MINLTYSKLRKIISLAAASPAIHKLFAAFTGGETINITETEMIDILIESDIDSEIISILAEKNPADMDAIEALQVLVDFFTYWKANAGKLQSWLLSIGYQVQKAAPKPSRKA